MSKPISQTEARRLRKQVRELQSKIDQITNSYSRDYHGFCIASFVASDVLSARMDVAKCLGHTLIARQRGNEIYIYAAEKSV